MSVNNALCIVSWNAQGISNSSKQYELNKFLNESHADVICLQETFLNHHNSFYVNNYTVYRRDRDAHGGGVAILLKDNIRHKPLNVPELNSVEFIAIEIKIRGSPLIIASAYSPKYSTHFKNDILQMFHLGSEMLIFGDFNAKHPTWNCANTNRAGLNLYNLQNEHPIQLYHPINHTHFPHSGATPSTIDLLITNSHVDIDNIRTSDVLFSDHCAIICDINNTPAISTQTKFNYKKANWLRFQHLIELGLNGINLPLNKHQIDSAISNFTSVLLNARAISVPVCEPRSQPTQLAPDTLAAIRDKNSLARRWRRCNNLTEKRQLKSSINCANKLIAELVIRDKNLKWEKFTNSLSSNRPRFWKISKSLRGKNGAMPDTIIANNIKLSANDSKAEALANVFAKSHTLTLNQPSACDQQAAAFANNIRQRATVSTRFERITNEELLIEIKRLKPFKAPGADGLQNILIKNLPASGRDFLTNIFNLCIKWGHWPSMFKTAKIIPIPKAGKNKNHAENYRPISLLNAIGKLFERMILSRILKFADEKQIIQAEQFGFRQQHSTTHQVERVVSNVFKNKAQKRSTGMVLFDIEKAFDTVWHDGLIYKLHQLNFPAYLCRLVCAFCTNRSFEVVVGGEKSRAYPIPAGLAQGSSLSPTLYSIYVSDLKLPKNINISIFADDTAISANANNAKTIIKRLQFALDKIENYFSKWKIKINAAKTQAIFFPFDKKKRRLPQSELVLNGSNIPFKPHITYLGVTLDNKLSYGPHITSTKLKVSNCIRAIYPLIGKKSKLSTNNKMIIFKTIVRPIMLYASPVWMNAAHSHIKHLQIAQNKCLKIIYNLPWRYHTNALHELTNMPLIVNHLHEINNKFRGRCAFSDYQIIRDLAS